jgi:hypothetical protein
MFAQSALLLQPFEMVSAFSRRFRPSCADLVHGRNMSQPLVALLCAAPLDFIGEALGHDS